MSATVTQTRIRRAVLAAIARREWLLQMMALAAAGCGQPKDRASTRGNTAIVAMPTDRPQPPGGDNAQWLTFLPLVAVNARGEREGRLAERWEHSADYRDWTYHLRPDVRWHDGVPVTADDVKFTLQLFAHPTVGEYLPHDFDLVDVLDMHTVRVRQTRRLDYSWVYVMYPKHLLEHLDPRQYWDWEFWKRPVGNGPYRFVSSQPPATMEFEANPDYYAGKPTIERVLLKYLGGAGLADLLAGNVDALTSVKPEWVRALAADSRFELHYSNPFDSSYVVILWQHRDPRFADEQVRRALTMAIDRRELLQVLHFPKDSPITDGPLMFHQHPSGELIEPLPHDPVRARELLDVAGWRDVGGRGLRAREGMPFQFTALVQPEYQPAAVYAQAQLRLVGVEMAVQVQDRSQVQDKLRKGEFQAVFFRDGNAFPWGMGLAEPRRVGANVFINSLGYVNPRVIELLQLAFNTLDPDVADRSFVELREIFHEAVPATWLVPMLGASAVHRRIRGLSAWADSDPLRSMGDLWLEERG